MVDHDSMGEGCRIDLRRLPEFAPGTGLWARIESAQRNRRRRQRWTSVGLAIAAAAVAAVAVMHLRGPAGPLAADLMAGQQESQQLESQWQQLAIGAQATPAGSTQLRVIDAALQSAYDRGAHQDEVAPLWQERNRALRGLIDGYRNNGTRGGLAVTRI
jgi:hypothetical protein